MRRVLLVLLGTAWCATAQFSDLAVTDDGAQVYFTSQVPLRSETDRGGGIYRWSGGLVERVVGPPAVDVFRPRQRAAGSVSGGGTVLTWTESSNCTGGSSCLSNPTTWSSTLILPGGQQPLIGRAQVSRNGRFVLNFQVLYYWFNTTATRELRDLQTSTLTVLDVAPASPRQAVTSDGRVLGVAGSDLVLWSPSGKTKLAESVYSGVVSDNGRTVVAAPGDGELHAIDTASDARRSLGKGVAPHLSNNGEQVLFLDEERNRVFLASTTSGQRRLLFESQYWIDDAVLTGFGQYAIVAVRDGRLLRIGTADGAVTELMPSTPLILSPAAAAPCDAIRLAAPDTTAIREVRLDDEVLPALTRNSGQIWVQIPCTTPVSDAARPLNLATDSPFGSGRSIVIRRIAPAFLTDTNYAPIIAHQNFSGSVNFDNPASPGETVHLWGTGFGAVDRPVGTGEPGPVSPPARLIEPVSCTAANRTWAPELVWAGLAPGLIGLYQFDVRIPAEAADSPGFSLECTVDKFVASALIPVRQSTAN